MRKESPQQTLRKELKSSPQVERLSMAEESAYDLLMARHRSLGINMEDFKDIYGPEEIDRDRERISSKKKIYRNSKHKINQKIKDPGSFNGRANRVKRLDGSGCHYHNFL